MSYLPTKHYNPRGYEVAFDGEADAWMATVRGYKMPNGRIVERGGPMNPDDKAVAKFKLENIFGIAENASSVPSLPIEVLETFHDALLDSRDLLGAPVFRNKPTDDSERRLFAAAYDAAQKVRANTTVLGVNKLLFMLNPSFCAFVDCFSRDASGAFWLMFATRRLRATSDFKPLASLSAYVLEAGEYIPANAQVRLGAWQIETGGATFVEVPNDRIAARDAVIEHLMKTPF